MTATTLTKSDLKRGRGLMWLTLAAAVSAAIAGAAIVSNRAANTATEMNETMYPGLVAASANAATIKIESPTVYVTLNKGADGKWVVADRSNYPANPDGVRALILSIAQLQLIERRTGDINRLGALDLTTGTSGTGHAVTITGADGTVLAAVVAGKVQGRAAGNSLGTLFVRRAGEEQTWLARGGIAIPASVGATLDKTLFTIDPKRIKSAAFAPRGLAAYTLSRATPETPDFTLDNVPEGKEAQPAGVLQTPATAIAGLTFDDVMKADAVDMKDATAATFTTFDGLTIKLTIVPGGPDSAFALFAVTADETATPEVKAEAAAINARTGGWGYKLPAYVLTNLVPTLESLVQDKAKPAAPEGEAPTGDGAAPAPEAPPAPPVPPQ
ncbi:hypothetical protein sos41_05280 [Alphaproteobacteria bacterium SO-S41]|nr:hypothetical protein sos41_05280 [Alphaproteobacteria bacterium SO-S41]